MVWTFRKQLVTSVINNLAGRTVKIDGKLVQGAKIEENHAEMKAYFTLFGNRQQLHRMFTNRTRKELKEQVEKTIYDTKKEQVEQKSLAEIKVNAKTSTATKRKRGAPPGAPK